MLYAIGVGYAGLATEERSKLTLKNLGNLVRYGALTALIGGMTVPAMADLVTNGNFSGQNPSPQGYLTFTSGQTFAGAWTVGDGAQSASGTGSVDWIGSYWLPPTGAAPLDGSVDLDGTSAGAISQTITTVPNGKYVLTFFLSGNPDNTSAPIKSLLVNAGTTGGSYTYDTTGNGHTSMNYIPESLMFTATSSSTVISFVSNDAAGSDWGPVVGGISVNPAATTPEPGFYGALAIGLSGLFYLVRRRQNA